jgi:hypothetical protein
MFTGAAKAIVGQVTEESFSTAPIYPPQSCIFGASLPLGARIAN